jgi:hypothetical protein
LVFGLVALLGLFWLSGFVGFLRADGATRFTLPRREQPPTGEYNLVGYRWGPTLRASSYFRDQIAHHHPLFLVDARAAPSGFEKWVTAAKDRTPWLELEWREPRAVSRVIIQHVGMFEPSQTNMREYTLRCLGEGKQPTLAVKDNQASVVEHALACPKARGLRIDWILGTVNDHARIYEIEVWGR